MGGFGQGKDLGKRGTGTQGSRRLGGKGGESSRWKALRRGTTGKGGSCLEELDDPLDEGGEAAADHEAVELHDRLPLV